MSLPEPVLSETPKNGPLFDRFGRAHTYLRVSVTDRCNYRCTYCMPAEGLEWLPRERMLTFEEITRLVGAFARMGVRRIRLTGGEPTLRRGIEDLVAQIAGIEGIEDVAMTTNGHAFGKKAEGLARAGLTRVNISLDSLDAAVFKGLTRGGDLKRVLAAVDTALEVGLAPVKINCVVTRGVNDGEAVALAEYFAERPGTELRFIEYMPFGGNDARRLHVPTAEIQNALRTRWTLEPLESKSGGPARDYRMDNGLVVGFISPITGHFCQACNRLRLQTDGTLRTCLSRDQAPNLRDVLRSGVDDAGLERAIRAQVFGKVAGHEAHLDGDFRAFEGVMTRVGG